MTTSDHTLIEVGLPTLGARESSGRVDLANLARHAEALGFDSVSVADLIVGDGTPALEATVVLAAVAVATERIRIGCVLALPLRPVALVAAQVQALQHISGNRLMLGVGAGGLPDSPFWRAVGVPGSERGRRTDSALAVLPRLIAGEPTRLADQPGQPVVTLAPPAPPPPILVGGNSRAAIRRAAVYADGWCPSQIGPATLARKVAELRDLAAERGRPTPEVHVGGLTIETDPGAARAARATRESFVHGLPGDHGISPEEARATITTSPAEAAERFAAYHAAGARGVGISPEPGISDADWMRLCELAAEARALMTNAAD